MGTFPMMASTSTLRRVAASAAVAAIVATTFLVASPARAADLVVTRTLPVTAGVIFGTLEWDLLVHNGGTGNANGAIITETLGGNFPAATATCTAATGGAVCPTFSQSSTGAGRVLSGPIPTLPNGGEIRIHIVATLPANPGSYQLLATVVRPIDEIPVTDSVVSQIFVRPISTDLAVTHSETVSGGANGVGGANGSPVASLNGDTTPVVPFPRTVTYRITNNGPDPVGSSAYSYTVGSNPLFSVSSIRSGTTKSTGSEAFIGAAAQYMASVPEYTSRPPVDSYVQRSFATPLVCQATGLTCPATTMYVISIEEGWFAETNRQTYFPIGWLDHEPTFVQSAGGGLDLIQADTDALNRNPFPNQAIEAGDAAIFTATWTDPLASLYSLLKPGTDALSSTSQLQAAGLLQCVPVESAHLVAQRIDYSGSVGDTNLGNNSEDAGATVTRSCIDGDLRVTIVSTAGGNTTVTRGEDITTVYTITNTGPGLVDRIIGSMSAPVLNWDGYSVGVPSCATSNLAAPCPTVAQLTAMLSGETEVTGVNLVAGAVWTITLTTASGIPVCGATGYTTGTQYLYIDQAGTGPAFHDISAVNNSASTPLVAAPQIGCGTGTVPYDLAVTKTGPFDAAGNPLSNVPVGSVAYYRLTYTNTSTNDVLIKNARFFDEPDYFTSSPAMYYLYDRGFVVGGSGMPLSVSNGAAVSLVTTSAVTCVANGDAVCPTGLFTMAYYPLGSGHAFGTFAGIIPSLPAVSVNPAANIELLVPFIEGHLITNSENVANCLPDSPHAFTVANSSAVKAGDLFGYGLPVSPRTQIITANGAGSVVPEADWVETVTTNNTSVANSTTVLPPCVTGHHLTLDKTVSPPSTETTLGAGDVAAFDVLVGNDGTSGMDLVTLSDSTYILCSNGGYSYNSNPCGELGSPTITCTVVDITVGGICPSGVLAFDEEFGRLTWGTLGDFSTLPAGSSLRFNISFAVTGRNANTAVVQNEARVWGPGLAVVREADYDETGTTPSQVGPIDTATITLPPPPGLSIAKSVDLPLAAPGDTVTYTVTVLNGAITTQPAGLRFADPVPAGLDSFTSVACTPIMGPSAAPLIPAVCPGVISNDANGIAATLPAVPGNSGLKFTITAIATDQLSSVNNSASVNNANAGLRATTNFATPVPGTSAIQGFKAIYNMTRPGAQNFKQGERLDYVISYANVSIYDIPNFQITDTLPGQVIYGGGMTVASSGGSTATADPLFDGSTNVRSVLPGAVLKAGGVITIRVPVTVRMGFDGPLISNQATGSGTGIIGEVPTDNVDDRNPACPQVIENIPCLPTGVIVTSGSVTQAQVPGLDPNVINQFVFALSSTGSNFTAPLSLGGILLLSGIMALAIRRRVLPKGLR